jgi:hypothetical protein
MLCSNAHLIQTRAVQLNVLDLSKSKTTSFLDGEGCGEIRHRNRVWRLRPAYQGRKSIMSEQPSAALTEP